MGSLCMWRFHIEDLPDFRPPSAYWPWGSQIRKALYMETSPIQNPLFSGSEAILGWFWGSGCYGSCMSTNCTYTPCLWWSSSISGMHHLVHLFKHLCLWLSGCFLFQGQAGWKEAYFHKLLVAAWMSTARFTFFFLSVPLNACWHHNWLLPMLLDMYRAWR